MDTYLIIFLSCLGIILLLIIYKYIKINFKFLNFLKKRFIIDESLLLKYKDKTYEEIMREARENLKCGNFSKAEVLYKVAKKKKLNDK